MLKVHLTRDSKGDRRGWYCGHNPKNPPKLWVTDKYKYLQFPPEMRCGKCGLYRDIEQFYGKGGV